MTYSTETVRNEKKKKITIPLFAVIIEAQSSESNSTDHAVIDCIQQIIKIIRKEA